MIEKPQIAESPAQTTATIRLTIPREQILQVMGPAYRELMTTVAAQGVTPSGPWYSYHYRMDPEIFDFEIGVPVPTPITAARRVKPGHMPATKVVRTVYHGGYEGLEAAWGEFDAWIAAQGLMVGPMLWERYVVGPESNPDPESIRTELCRPLIG